MQETPRLQTARIGTRDLAWRERGDGEPLVLIHGIGGSSESWDPLWPVLERQFRVIAWDMPGYGGSEPLASAVPGVDDYANELERLLAHLCIKRANIVGHSLGALLAAALCQRNPSLAHSVCFIHGITGMGGLEDSRREGIRHERLDEMANLGLQGFAEKRGRGILGPDVSAAAADRIIQIMSEIPLSAYAQAWEMLCNADITHYLHSIRVPSLVVGGGNDPVATEAVCRLLAAEITDARLVIEPEVGHYIMYERPETFLMAFRRFYREYVAA